MLLRVDDISVRKDSISLWVDVTCMVDGTNPICPDTYRVLSTRTACTLSLGISYGVSDLVVGSNGIRSLLGGDDHSPAGHPGH